MSTVNPPVLATGGGLGYGIAIAVSILVLISTIMLASYACIRVKTSNNFNSNDSSIEEGDNHQATSSANSTQPVMVGMGLDKPEIDSFPKMLLGQSRRLPSPNNGPCSICLSEYQPKDTIRCIPECNHCFHADCVDGWLKMSATCPLCRNSPAPSRGSTPACSPLSDSVPLALHSR